MKKQPLFCLGLFLFICLNLAKSQIIVNGSFETAQVSPGGSYVELMSGNTSIDNWTIDNGSIDYIGGLWVASDGNRSIDLNGTQAGTISQSITTEVGVRYCVNFDLAGNPGGAPNIKRLNVSVANTSLDFTFDITGLSSQNMGWESINFEFIAIGTTSTLTFSSLISGNAGPAIDNVAVTQCEDCAGTPNGTAVIDDCGVCLEPTDPDFNACLDCEGTPNGTAVIDDCGVCLELTDPNFNACLDCAGTPNGAAVIDDCGACLDPTDPAFNACYDCEGTLNGTAILDDCGVCLEPTDPNFNACLDCTGTPNGTAIMDDCGACLDPTDPDFNACYDCAGTLNGTAVVDDCGVCLEPTDPDFNRSCGYEDEIYIPNVFSPNSDGANDRFQIFKKQELEVRITSYQIFGRWGSLIYELKDAQFNANVEWWDGTFKGEKVEAGVYIYRIEVEFSNGVVKNYNGDVTIAVE